MAKLRIGALEMAARIGGNTIIVHPLAVHHVPHSVCAPFIRLPTPIRIAPNEKGGLFRSEAVTTKDEAQEEWMISGVWSPRATPIDSTFGFTFVCHSEERSDEESALLNERITSGTKQMLHYVQHDSFLGGLCVSSTLFRASFWRCIAILLVAALPRWSLW
jgi:hypothetical protein